MEHSHGFVSIPPNLTLRSTSMNTVSLRTPLHIFFKFEFVIFLSLYVTARYGSNTNIYAKFHQLMLNMSFSLFKEVTQFSGTKTFKVKNMCNH